MNLRLTEMQEIETTAHVISATLALLALHPEEQDNAVEEIRSILSDGRDPVWTMQHMSLHTY